MSHTNPILSSFLFASLSYASASASLHSRNNPTSTPSIAITVHHHQLPSPSSSPIALAVHFQVPETCTCFHDLDYENAVTSPEARSQGTSQGASSLKPSKKNKKAKDEKEFDGIREALHEVAQALKEGNEVYQRVKQPVPSITEDQVWKPSEDLKIEEHQMDTTYLYLIDHPEKVRAVLGCPQDKHKKILLQMVFGPPVTARNKYKACLSGMVLQGQGLLSSFDMFSLYF